MRLERGSTRIYACPVCGIDTPHTIKAQRGEIYAVVCSNCTGAALVPTEDLQLYQHRWEAELKQILDELAPPHDMPFKD